MRKDQAIFFYVEYIPERSDPNFRSASSEIKLKTELNMR